jgi:hypothetical protein
MDFSALAFNQIVKKIELMDKALNLYCLTRQAEAWRIKGSKKNRLLNSEQPVLS